MMLFRVLEFIEAGKSPFATWFGGLDPVTAARVDRYVRRLEAGNFGNVKAIKGGISELRIDFGAGYRVYFGMEGKQIVILLGGGDKRRQARDIAIAVARWSRYRKGKVQNGINARI